MCIILDANCLGDFHDWSNEDMLPIRKWMKERNGKIAYSDTERFKSEWKSKRLNYKELNRAGQLKLVPKEDVLDAQARLAGKLESDDPHLIALAIVANVNVLVVQRQSDEPLRGGRRRARGGDTALQKDFKKWVRGKIYITADHKHLLTRDTCP